MKNKNKKGIGQVLILIILVLVIVLILRFGNFGTGSLIQDTSSNPLPIEKGVYTFSGIQGNYETPKLGCLTSGQYIIADDNDGQVSLCNSIDGINELKLYSSFSGTANGINYIEYKAVFPAGKIKINYDYSLSEYYTNTASIKFIAGDFNKYIKIPTASGKGHSLSGNGVYEFDINNKKEVLFRIETGIYQKQESSTGTMIIEFIPEVISSTTNNPTGAIILNDNNSSSDISFLQKIINFFKNIFGGSK